MAEMINNQSVTDLNKDMADIGKAINEDTLVDPRSGLEFSSIPKVVRESEEKVAQKLNDLDSTSFTFLNDLSIRYLALSLRGEWNISTAYTVKDLVFVNNITYICLIGHTSTSSFENDLNSGKWFVYQGATQVDLQYYTPLSKDYPPVLAERCIRLRIDDAKGAFRFGLSDTTPLDDFERNFFRGLTNKDAWADENIGTGSNASGRNNCAPAYLADAGSGHDCIAYGVASKAAGAACCTGNPDDPHDGTTWGYGSEAGGRNSWAKGRLAKAFGEFCDALSRYSVAMGYKAIAGPSDPEDPNYLPDGIEGAAAYAHGYEVGAHGNFAVAIGAFVKAFNGAMVIGRGIFSEQGIKPLEVSKRGIGIGFNVDKPTIFCKEGDGVSENGAWIGFNTELPMSRYDYRCGESDTITHVIESTSGNGLLANEVKGLMSDGTYKSLHNVVVSHPNAGQAYGTVAYYLNGSAYMTVDQSRKVTFTSGIETGGAGLFVGGKRVVGGQLAALADLPANATLANVINQLNTMLEGERLHGLRAT